MDWSAERSTDAGVSVSAAPEAMYVSALSTELTLRGDDDASLSRELEELPPFLAAVGEGCRGAAQSSLAAGATLVPGRSSILSPKDVPVGERLSCVAGRGFESRPPYDEELREGPPPFLPPAAVAPSSSDPPPAFNQPPPPGKGSLRCRLCVGWRCLEGGRSSLG
jgi:hypothetical protein